jgi:hypothetical protein
MFQGARASKSSGGSEGRARSGKKEFPIRGIQIADKPRGTPSGPEGPNDFEVFMYGLKPVPFRNRDFTSSLNAPHGAFFAAREFQKMLRCG